MKGTLLFSILLTSTVTMQLPAQPPVGKCLSGDCNNGQGKYQLNSYATYEGGFRNGKFYGPGKVFNSAIVEITGSFADDRIENCHIYTASANQVNSSLRFEGKAYIAYSNAEQVKKSWTSTNYFECNGNFFVIKRDSGRSYLNPGLYDTTRYAISGRISPDGKITGPGLIHKGNRQIPYDFGSGTPYSFEESLISIARNQFAITTPDISRFTCLSGNCKNGKGKARLNEWATYDGEFKNGKMNGPGKISHDNGSWYSTGIFNGNTILNFQFYEKVTSGSYSLKRKSKGDLIVYDEATAQSTWTTNNYYYWDKQFFKISETDTITWYYKPDFYLKVRPDKKRAILFVNKKMYAFLLHDDPSLITEDLLKEHLKRMNYQNKYAYTYDRDIMTKPVIAKKQPVQQNGNRLLNAGEISVLTKAMSDQTKATLTGTTIAEGYLEGGDTYVKYKTIYVDAAPGDVFSIFAFVKYSAPVTISLPQWDNPNNNLPCKGNRITDAGATVHPSSCLYANQTRESKRVRFEISVSNSPEPGYYLITKARK